MTGLIQSLITIFVFILLLGSLVLIHELGHFITARWAKVRVLEFGIGFPPRAKVLGRGKRPAYDAGRPPRPDPALPPGVEPGSDEAEAFLAAARAEDAEAGATLYTLNWLPIGGFVKLEGEDGSDDADPHSFSNAKLWIKVGILLAGRHDEPAARVRDLHRHRARRGARRQRRVRPGRARIAGRGRRTARRRRDLLRERRQRYSIFDIGTGYALDDIRALAGEEVVIGVVHADGTTSDVTVQLRVPATPQQGALGISVMEVVPYGTVNYSPVRGGHARRPADGRRLRPDPRGPADLGRSIVTSPTTAPPASGPVGIAVEIGDVLWNLGPIYVLYMAALLSANLALVNILPFPPLDGGRILMILLKAIPGYGKRISLRAEQLTYAVGFVALFTFLIWITVFDVAKQVGGGQ